MALAGNPKILVSWLGKQDARTLELNKGRSGEGKGKIYLDDKGKMQEEDMSSYLTGTKKFVFERQKDGKAILKGELKGNEVVPYSVDGKQTNQGKATLARVKEIQAKALAFEEKASKAEAIAARATHPEQIKRANLLMSRFRGQAKKLKDWITGQGKVEPVKTQEVEPAKKVEKLATAIAKDASQLQEVVAQVNPEIPGQKAIAVMGGDLENAMSNRQSSAKSKPPKTTEKETAIAAKPVAVAPKPKPAEAKSEPKPTTPKPKSSNEGQKAQPKPDSKHSMSDVVSAFNSKKIDSLDGLTITPLTMTKESVQGQVGLDAKRIMQFEPTSMGNATYLQFEMGGQSWMVPNNKSPHFQKIVANLKTENTGIFDVDGDSIRLSKPALLKRAANGNLEIAERGKMGDTVEKITPQPKSSATSSKPVEASQVQETPFKDEEIPNVADAIRSGFKLAGEGAYGKVYVKGNQAVKYANIKENEYAIAKQADELGIGPKVYARNSTQAVGERAMAMEFLAGDPLERTAPLNGKSLNGEHFDLTIGLMAKMHTAGIAHGDLHTGNMILTDGDLKAIDFGNSRVDDHKAIIEEMLKPSFIRDRPFSDTEITTEGSKLRSRYDSARQGFMDQYGKSGENWPTGKDAEKAIADFYKKVLNGSKSQATKPVSAPATKKDAEQPVVVTKSTSKSPVRTESPKTNELQRNLPDKYRSMSNDELAAHSGDLRRTLADLIVFDRVADKAAQTRLKEDGFDVSNGEKLKEATNTIRELLSSFPSTSPPSPRPNPVPVAQPNVVAIRTAPPVKNAKNTDESNLTNLGRETKDNNWYQLSSDAKDVGTRNPFGSKRKTLLAKEENGTINGGVTVKFDDKFENAEITAIASTEGKQWESTMEGLIVNAAIAVKKGFLAKDKSDTQRNPTISRASSNNAEIEILKRNGFTKKTGKGIKLLREQGWLKPGEEIYTASVDDILSVKKQEDRANLPTKNKGNTVQPSVEPKSTPTTEPVSAPKSKKEDHPNNKQVSLNSAHQRNIYSIATGGKDLRDLATVKKQDKLLYATKEDFQKEKLERLKEAGLSELEALGVAAWIGDLHVAMNKPLYSQGSSMTDDLGESAGVRAIQGLSKLDSYSKQVMSELADAEGFGLNKDGVLVRRISISPKDMDTFLAPYRDAVGSTEFREPIFFATAAIDLPIFGRTTNVMYKVKPIADGTGQGKMVDAFKDVMFEGEVLYPPYSKFKVLDVEIVKKPARLSEVTGTQMFLPQKYKDINRDDLVSHYDELQLLGAYAKSVAVGEKLSNEQVKSAISMGIDPGDKSSAALIANDISRMFMPNKDTIVIHMEEL